MNKKKKLFLKHTILKNNEKAKIYICDLRT